MELEKQIKLYLGDNMKSLDLLPDNSIDSVVTDGPYGLSFMNKKWDYDVPSVEFWKKVYQKLKPGGHVLSFGGTRTYHRMVVNMEDAGFEIRDQIMWIYGSGFPKSHNIGKSFDKKQGNEREEWLDDKKTQPNIRGNGDQLMISSSSVEVKDREPIKYSKGSSQYEGWGTALKPANEPICLARKPLSEKTIVDNVIKWGTGGINIEGCRIGTEPISHGTSKMDIRGKLGDFHTRPRLEVEDHITEGRFPANILFDETAAEILDKQSGISKAKKERVGIKGGSPIHQSKMKVNIEGKWPGDNGGGASRFFYIAKVSKKERNLGLEAFDEVDESKNKAFDVEGGRTSKYDLAVTKNTHPTLKPINLMTYLCRLITPPGGICLDPFMGSGSTGISACLEGFRFIGMELDEDYFKIAEARINSFEEYRKLLK